MSVMKKALASLTPWPIRRAAIRLGAFFATVDKHKGPVQFPSQEGAFQTLKKHGWNPRACIDVGAYHGEWTAMFRSLFPGSRVLMIEAQQSKAEILRAIARDAGGAIDYAPALLGSSDGVEVEFNEMETGSSVFSEASHYQRSTVKKQLSKLDSVLAEHPGFQDADCLKIDTQGYELEVLGGAKDLLKSVDVVLLEVSLLQVNAGCPLFADVVAYMAAAGFCVFDFCSQIRRRDGVLWQTDLLFIRRGGRIVIEPRLTHETWG